MEIEFILVKSRGIVIVPNYSSSHDDTVMMVRTLKDLTVMSEVSAIRHIE